MTDSTPNVTTGDPGARYAELGGLFTKVSYPSTDILGISYGTKIQFAAPPTEAPK